MMARKIKCNDDVVVLTGRDRGKRGKVKFILTKKNQVIVTGVNLVKKHQKPIPDRNQPGSILKKEAPIDLSNVAIFNPILKKSDRVGFKKDKGKKVRFFKSDGSVIK